MDPTTIVAPELPRLVTGRLELRSFTLDDAARLREHAGDARVAGTTLRIPHPYEEGMAEEFIRAMPAARLGGQLTWAVARPEEGLLRQHVVARGKVEDLVVCGALRSDWTGMTGTRNGGPP